LATEEAVYLSYLKHLSNLSMWFAGAAFPNAISNRGIPSIWVGRFRRHRLRNLRLPRP